MNTNPLLCTDVYKLGHMEFYKPGTTKIYSYLEARSDKKFSHTVFFGLQYYLKQFLSKPVTKEQAEEFFDYRMRILGGVPEGVRTKINALVELGYIPLKIKAVPEGLRINNRNVLMTVTNTHPDFYWCVGFFESLLLKVWNTCTVATYSYELRQLFTDYCEKTGGIPELIPFQVHDFGYRGCSSEETAALSGMAHLTSFLGTDTVPAVKCARDFYSAAEPVGLSVPASEHSVMCSFGFEDEIEAFRHMLKVNPTGIVSIVSDTYNLWNVLDNFAVALKDEILSRQGKVVFRPDSGEPEKILLGGRMADHEPWTDGVFDRLADVFGSTLNDKGYRSLHPNVGAIYGDGMYDKRIRSILAEMDAAGYCSSNLVIGVGGLLLQQHNRDDLGFAFKATHAVINGHEVELFKDPITDPGKRSKKGLMSLWKTNTGTYFTTDCTSAEDEKEGLLSPVYENGMLLVNHKFADIRKRLWA